MNGDKIHELSKNQVWDEGRGSFFVGLKRTKNKYKGQPVYQDAFGLRIAVKGAE